jgi:hypothetical protein
MRNRSREKRPSSLRFDTLKTGTAAARQGLGAFAVDEKKSLDPCLRWGDEVWV